MFGLGFRDGWAAPMFRPVGPEYVTLPAYTAIAGFGDSITSGTSVGATANRWLNRIAAPMGASVLNAGIAGTVLQNSADAGGAPRAGNGRDRFAASLGGANLRQAVFTAYGFNDARYIAAPGTFNAANYASDYREVLNGLLMLGYARTDIYVLAPYYITDAGLSTGSTGFAGQTRAGFETFVSAAQAVAGEFGVRFCNLYAELGSPAYIANVDGNDHVHPTDAGHALIAAAIQTRTVAANPRPAPAHVAAVAGSGSIAASCAATGGAASYEFVAISNHADGPVQAAAGPAYAFTGLAAGSYRIKARAVFGDGGRSPWTLAPGDSAVSASGPFVQDSFTDAAGTGLGTRTADTGGAWSSQAGVSANGQYISNANRLRTGSSNGVYQNGAVPGGADYYVEADLVCLTLVTGSSAGLAARMATGVHTLYFVRYLVGSGWQVFKTIAGASTQLGATMAAPALAAGQTRRLRLEVSGSANPQLTVKVDGEIVLSVTDDSGTRITDAGKAGVRCTGSVGDTTGIHLDNFAAGLL